MESACKSIHRRGLGASAAEGLGSACLERRWRLFGCESVLGGLGLRVEFVRPLQWGLRALGLRSG